MPRHAPRVFSNGEVQAVPPGQPATPGGRFRRHQRVRRHAEFEHIFSSGTRYHGRYLTLVVAATPGGHSRLGLVASRKIGNAVARNRAKRLIREVFRAHVPRPGTAKVDIVVIPRREFFEADFATLAHDFGSTLRRSTVRAERDAR